MAGFGGAVKLTGESQYRQALSSIARSLREVGSEMKVVSSTYDKNDRSTASISAKTDVLNRKLEQQKSRLSTLQAQYKSYSATMQQNAAKHQELTQKYESEKAKLNAIGSSLGKTSSEYKKQQQVVDGLSQELQKSSQNQERNANTMSKLRVQMNNAQADINKTGKEIKQLGESSEETSPKVDKLKNAMTKAGSAMKVVAKAGAVAIGALATAGVAIGKQSLEAYAKYEQMVGGVDTLFKKSSKLVQSYAANAYKTAGLSANDYMDTVTSFSASLLQSLGGNTKKAAVVANRAITDMSDNANKMGTDMGSIQYAYQGFAKQNYTMLDNLKLGYGGTKTEMQRLIKDASQMKDVQKELGVTVDGSSLSFANCVNAISVMQKHLGIAGTTAKEASTTIEGSVNSMEAAWANLMVGLADDNANFPALMSNFTDSLTTMLSNVVPRIKVIVEGIGKLVQQLTTTVLPQILKELPSTLNSLLPSLIQSVTTLVTSVAQALPSLMPVLLNAITVLAQSLATALPQIFQAVVQAVTQLLQQLADATSDPASTQKAITGFINMVDQIVTILAQNAPALIEAGIQLILNLTKGFIQSMPMLIQRVPEIVDKAANIINTNAPKLLLAGVKMILMLGKGIIQSIPSLIANFPKIIKTIWDVFTAVQWLSLGKTIIKGLGNGIKAMAGFVKSHATNISKSITTAFKSLPSKLLSLGKQAVSKLGSAIKSGGGTVKGAATTIFRAIINALKTLPSKLLSLGKQAISRLASGMGSMAHAVASKALSIAKSIPAKIRTAVNEMNSVGRAIIQGLIAGISGAVGALWSKVNSIASGIKNRIKNALKIHSPSRVMRDEVGKNIVLGIQAGMESQSKSLYTYIDKMSNDILGAFKTVPTSQYKNVGSAAVKSFSEGVSESIKTTQKGVTKSIRIYFDNLTNENEAAQDKVKSKYEKQQKATEKKYEKQIDSLEKRIKTTKNKNAKKNLQNELSNVKKQYSKVKKTQKEEHNKQLKELQSQNSDIKSLYNDFGKTVGEQFNSALESVTNEITDELTEKVNNLTEAMQSEIDAVQSKIDSMYSKLSEYGVFFNTKTNKKTGLETVELTDITKQTEVLQKYYSNLRSLKGRVSNDLIDAIANMSVDDAIKYTDQLLNMTESQLTEYDKAYTEKLELSNRIAEDIFQDRIDAIKDKYIPQIEQAFSDAKAAMSNIGERCMKAFLDAMNEQEWSDEIKKTANKIVKIMQKELEKGMSSISSSIASQAEVIGKAVSSGVAKGIDTGNKKIGKSASNLAKSAVKSTKKKLKIHSPSAVFRDEVGKMVAQGFGIGFTEEMKTVSRNMANAVPKNFSISPEVTSANIAEGRINNNLNMIESFKAALKQMKIELDEEVAGKFVERTVSNAIYR